MVLKINKKFDFLQLIDSIVTKDIEKTIEIIKEGIKKGIKPGDIITNGIQPAMVTVGDKFSTGEFFIPDMLLSARVSKKAIEFLEPYLKSENLPTLGRVIIGTVRNDIHDIGKNLVAKFLYGVGFEVIDLGINISAESFVKAVKKYNPDIVALSALLTTTMLEMANVITALEEANLRSKVKIIVGGAPITERFSEQIGADGYSPEGASAARLCKKLIAKQIKDNC